MMILKMTLVTALYVLLTTLIWYRTKDKELKTTDRIIIGVIYGLCSILSTHFAIDYKHMLLNVRDLGPLSAGLFFDPVSGIIAGLIGGIERYIAGTWWGVGSYTRVACSVSTCLAGFLSAGMHVFIFKRKKPSAFYAFFMGAVMEVFHMYVVFITHREDMSMAFYVVKTCSPPMIIFSGIGLAVSSLILKALTGELWNPFERRNKEDISVTQRFQFWLFAVVFLVLMLNLVFEFQMQSQTARQDTRDELFRASAYISDTYTSLKQAEVLQTGDPGNKKLMSDVLDNYKVGTQGTFDIIAETGYILFGDHGQTGIAVSDLKKLRERPTGEIFKGNLFRVRSLCLTEQLPDGSTLLVQIPETEMYYSRDVEVYETAFADIILFAVIYVMIYLLVQEIVVNNLNLINASLDRITGGNLDEVVSVRNSSEFASLSDDINQTVTALKGYIEAAEKRIEQELEFARTIQDSSLPKTFTFPRKDFEIYATMDPAKEVGGDFYDFFFVDANRIALVIADVSGKGIPAALFMMRSKTAIRGFAESGYQPAEILRRANNSLCEGNDAEMFVTVWIGIIDLSTGKMSYANAGHEHPVIMREGGDYEYIKVKHSPALACMEDMKYREFELDLYPGDRLFVYTDGIPEAIDENVEQYGPDRLIAKLNNVKTKSMNNVLPAVRRDIADFVGDADQFDDITMLGFIFKGNNTGS